VFAAGHLAGGSQELQFHIFSFSVQ
jgi:hypothetical protein